MRRLTMRRLTMAACAAVLAAQGATAQTAGDRTPHASMWLRAFEKAGAQVPYRFDGEGKEVRVAWGLDTAWDSADNVRRGTAFIGKDNIATGRISFQPSDLVGDDGELSAAQKKALDSRIANIKLSGTTSVMLNCDHEALNAGNYYGKPEEWYKVIKASVKYAQAKGLTVVSVSPFNEPDYTPWGEGTKAHFKAIAKLISEDGELDGIRVSAGNTLNCDEALSWYNYMKPYATEGNTHQLAGSFDSYAGFFTAVRNNGHHASADELHNVAEAMVGVEYGLQSGVWWGYDGVARGDYCKAANGGARLGYAENRGAWTAASVYRLPGGAVEAFLGTSERQATTSAFEFVSLDRDVYYDGYGPVRAFRMEMPGGTGYQQGQTNAERMIRITQGEDVQPFAVEGGTYVIMNRKTKGCLTIAGGATAGGTAVVQGFYKGRAAAYPYQQWTVEAVGDRVGGDFSYSYIRSARDEKMLLDLLNWSLSAKGTLCAYPGDGGANEQWYFEYAGDGDFYIRSRHSALCLEVRNGSSLTGAAVQQAEFTGDARQRWRFIPVDAESELDAPAVPAGLEATPQSASVLLAWQANSEPDADGYMVLRGERTAAGATDWSVIGRKVQGTRFIDNSCAPGRDYAYKIRCIDRAGNMSAATDEVAARTQDGKSVVARYEFDGTAEDLTPNQFDAALSGNAEYGAAVSQSGSGALRLDGSTYLILPHQLGNMREMTVALWAYWQTVSSWQRLFDFGNGTDQYMFLTPSNGSEMRFVLKNGGDEQILSAPRLSTRRFVHLAVTLGPDGVRLYVDGELAAERADITIRPSDFAPVMNYIGRSQFSADPYFRGYIDDFRVYNHALTAQEVREVKENLADGIGAVAAPDASPVVATECYSVGGVRLAAPRRGVGILRQTHRDGTVTVRKVLR